MMPQARKDKREAAQARNARYAALTLAQKIAQQRDGGHADTTKQSCRLLAQVDHG